LTRKPEKDEPMMPKTTALLLAGLFLFPLQAAAQKSEGQTYVVRKGDTLWGISERFIKDPDYWPSLWSHNPEVANPHFIYPGQTITLYDPGFDIVPAPATAPPVAASPAEILRAEPLADEGPLLTFRTRRGSEGFIAREELSSTGTVVDTADNRIMIATGDTVFMEMKNLAAVAVGDQLSAFKVGAPVLHPTSGTVVGHKVSQLGTIRVASLSDHVATGAVITSFREMERGALLRPYYPSLKEIPLKRASRSLSTQLLAAEEDKLALGTEDIIYFDLGNRDGLEVGNVLTISRPRQVTELARERKDLQLPHVLLGAAVVLETYPHSATALVIKAVGPIYRGDLLSTMTD
jgi:LysM repeat protein